MQSTLRVGSVLAQSARVARVSGLRRSEAILRTSAACGYARVPHALYVDKRWCAASGASEKHEFKAETKKLLDIVAKSLYTDKEVFIRELISNSSDACEKVRFLQNTGKVKTLNDNDIPLHVRLSVNEKERKFVIEDTGVGMTREELIDHLGTIAKSGSLAFLENADASNIIGQFGVGFYSSFVVADKVNVYTKTCDPSKGNQGFLWSSEGDGSFTLTEVPDVPRGTKIELYLNDDATEFAKISAVKKSCEKFSSFIDFPLLIVEDGEDKTVNKQDALWLKTSATAEEHQAFFRYLGGTSYGEPYYTLMYQTDAPLSIKSCLYIPDPDNAPSRMFTRDPQVAVALHSRRVMVKKNADGVIPKWLHWVKGVVDCEDMPMNISRENMQDSRLMEKLSMAIVRRILRFLIQQAKKEPEKYAKFWKGYSYYLKAGIIEDKEGNFSRHKDDLVKLLRFDCSNSEKGDNPISLEEYIEKAHGEQKNIYYLTCPDRQTALSSPYMEQFLQRKRNVLILVDDIDEFVINSLEGYKDKKFVSVDANNADFELGLDAPDDDSKEEKRRLTEAEQKELETFIKSVLKEKIQEVKFSDRLVSSPAVVTSVMTPHMRKMMKQLMAGKENDGMSNIPMTFELSPEHHIVTTLHTIKLTNETVARIAVEQLYDNALIAAGTLDDPRVLLSRLNKVLEMFIYQGAGFDYATNEYKNVGETSSSNTAASSEPTASAASDSKPASSSESKFEEVKTATSEPKSEEVKPSKN